MTSIPFIFIPFCPFVSCVSLYPLCLCFLFLFHFILCLSNLRSQSFLIVSCTSCSSRHFSVISLYLCVFLSVFSSFPSSSSSQYSHPILFVKAHNGGLSVPRLTVKEEKLSERESYARTSSWDLLTVKEKNGRIK